MSRMTTESGFQYTGSVKSSFKVTEPAAPWNKERKSKFLCAKSEFFFGKLKCAQKRLNSNFKDGNQAVCRENKLFEHEKTRNQQMGEIKVFYKIQITGMARPASSGPP